jgi:hypothetical protein
MRWNGRDNESYEDFQKLFGIQNCFPPTPEWIFKIRDKWLIGCLTENLRNLCSNATVAARLTQEHPDTLRERTPENKNGSRVTGSRWIESGD